MCTINQEALYNPPSNYLTKIPICNHEEADTRIFVHAYNCIENGYKKIVIKSVDTDVLALAIFYQYQNKNQDVWIEFGTGKNLRYISCMEVANKINEKSLALPFFHSLTGLTSSFFGNERCPGKLGNLLRRLHLRSLI